MEEGLVTLLEVLFLNPIPIRRGRTKKNNDILGGVGVTDPAWAFGFESRPAGIDLRRAPPTTMNIVTMLQCYNVTLLECFSLHILAFPLRMITTWGQSIQVFLTISTKCFISVLNILCIT